jgi:hypothetical protein
MMEMRNNMNRKTIGLAILLLVVIVFVSTNVIAQEEDGGDIEILGFELEKILAMLNAWIALFLFIVAFIAYRRDGRQRLLFVSVAFLLFSIKSFMLASELFFPEVSWFDPVGKILEFGALLSFFFGVLRK